MSILPWKFSLFRGGFNTVQPYSASVKEDWQLDKLFHSPSWKPSTFNKKKLDCWSPSLYPPGKTRANKNVQSISAIVFDYDGGTWSPARMGAHLKELGIAYAVYTTWSHDDEEPRYRVVIFIDRPLSRKEFTIAREAALSLIGYTEGVDAQCNDLARHYALPIRKTGSSYESYLDVSLPPLCVDSLMAEQTDSTAEGLVLSEETKLTIAEWGEEKTVKDLVEEGPGKYKCACPFQEGASFGSAFLRVCKDERVFLQCTSDGHTHEQKQFWLGGKKKKEKKPRRTRSLQERKETLTEVSDAFMAYVETNLSFNFPQGVFYRRERGAWQIQSPLRKDTVVNHLIGKLQQSELGMKHVQALVDHILSRQVYGFDCDSSRGAIVPSDDGPLLNLYAPPEIEAVPGNFPRIEHILDILSGGDDDLKKWLKHWSAAVVQHPERRSMVAVLCLSPQQGIGKSMYGRLLASIIGERNSAIVSNRSLRDSFNANFVTKLLVLADEVGIGGRDNDVIASLKAYVTDDRVPCRAPYASRTEVENRMTWWMTSNERRPLMIEEDDRRFTVLVPRGVDTEYRKMLSKCFNPKTGKYTTTFLSEVQGFGHYLHSMSVDYKSIMRPYSTRARKLLQEASRSSIDEFVLLVQHHGAASIITDYPAPPEFMRVGEAVIQKAVPCELLYGSYATWCDRRGRRDVRQEANLRLAFQQLERVYTKRMMIGGKGIDCYLGLPSAQKKESKVVEMPG
tara:strand:+ start:2040 stop:4244 length:2205 start_codon:yes stop_codon:yes gene_type:complete